MADRECHDRHDWWNDGADCLFVDDPGCHICPWEPVEGAQYYERGAMNLKWNYNYGAFSKAYYNWVWDGEDVLLTVPETVAEDGLTALSSAFWLYMTPRDINPSPHDVVIRRFVPNRKDIRNKITQGFGTTINILYTWDECGQKSGRETAKAARRSDYYIKLLQYFNYDDISGEQKNLDCRK